MVFSAFRFLAGWVRRALSPKRWLFLDDVRNPPGHLRSVFDTARSHAELVAWVEERGIPELVSFDHDLHPEHVSFFFDGGGFRNPPDPSFEVFANPTGYDSAKWLLERCESEGRHPRYVIVHSNNPKGSDRIVSLVTGSTWGSKTEITCRRIRWGETPRR